jgi:hypothetical protein
MNNPTEQFQTAVIDAVNDAAKNNVHPAIVYTILGGLQSDVLLAIKQSNRMAQTAATAESILKSKNSPPANVIQLPKTDTPQ